MDTLKTQKIRKTPKAFSTKLVSSRLAIILGVDVFSMFSMSGTVHLSECGLD